MSAADTPKPEPTPAGEIDRLIHEPARLAIVALLAVVESADMVFLQRQTGLTMGNLSSHVTKLEAAGYVRIDKTFAGRRPRTMLALTPEGRAALEIYRRQMQAVLEGLPPAAGADGSGDRG